jgi:hypothetical protein
MAAASSPPRAAGTVFAMPSPQPLLASTTFMYVESDIPEGMSLDAWRRRGNAAGARPSLLTRVWRAMAD